MFFEYVVSPIEKICVESCYSLAQSNFRDDLAGFLKVSTQSLLMCQGWSIPASNVSGWIFFRFSLASY